MKRIILGISLCLLSLNGLAQDKIDLSTLPEYIIITSENTKLLGGINIIIDYKKSEYKDKLEELEIALRNRKQFGIRNQTDLLNKMSSIGYEYVDAYNANSGSIGIGGGDDIDITGSTAKFRINMVFKKK
ncbi:MAG: hypothetical protein ACPG6V_11550 [Flavobacteriales bacterium]